MEQQSTETLTNYKKVATEITGFLKKSAENTIKIGQKLMEVKEYSKNGTDYDITDTVKKEYERVRQQIWNEDYTKSMKG